MNPAARAPSTLAVVGDLHGHLQLALSVLARWQTELGVKFEAVFLCGDVGTFTRDEELDSTTRSHGRSNPCELEFLNQWSARPPAPWLDYIFKSPGEEGLGLTCPVIMVHGNHEGFLHLESLVRPEFPRAPVEVNALPTVDTGGHIRLLPSGWAVALPSGVVAGGIGGIEEGQRFARYHRMAYLDEAAILHLCEEIKRVDLFLTHQGPASIQGAGGSPTLERVLDAGVPRAWFHGHSLSDEDIHRAGPGERTLVVPLEDIAFPGRDPENDLPGAGGWAAVTVGDDVDVRREPPPFLREFRRGRWTRTKGGLLVSPALAHLAWRFREWG